MNINLSQLNVAIGDRQILTGLSLSISSGELLSIVGANGTGKTTLLRCLAGLTPYTGEIRYGDSSINSLSAKQRATRVGYLPQTTTFLPSFTVFEFVAMGRYAHTRYFARMTEEERSTVKQALSECDLTSLADRRLPELSGGERQRVLLAALLAQAPEVFLLDEPTSFLDPYHEEKLFELIKKLHAQTSKTFIVVSHNLNRAILSSNRLVALKDRGICFEGSPAEFTDHRVLQDVFGTTFATVSHPESSALMLLPS